VSADYTPAVIVLAGPNGAGKSTVAPKLLKGKLAVDEFVNADTIAQGLSGFAPERVAMAAGRIMLERIKELAEERATFAFETTLASRSFAPWLDELIRRGYRFHLSFLWLESADLAIARVRSRVRMGGHDVPEETIRRRWRTGLQNFFRLYRPLTSTWRFYDNSFEDGLRLIALGQGSAPTRVHLKGQWTRITKDFANAS
jgi:predicted ABC-type ATPase